MNEINDVIANVNWETLYASIVSKIAPHSQDRQLWEHWIAGEHFRRM